MEKEIRKRNEHLSGHGKNILQDRKVRNEEKKAHRTSAKQRVHDVDCGRCTGLFVVVAGILRRVNPLSPEIRLCSNWLADV